MAIKIIIALVFFTTAKDNMQSETDLIITKHIETSAAHWGPLFIMLDLEFNDHWPVFEELLCWINDLQVKLGFTPLCNSNVVKITFSKKQHYIHLDDFCKYSWLNEMRRFTTMLYGADVISAEFYIIFTKFIRNQMLHHLSLFTPEMNEVYKKCLESTLRDRIIKIPRSIDELVK